MKFQTKYITFEFTNQKNMNNKEIIDRINAYQHAGFVHELTCSVDSSHGALIPVEKNGKVVLKCETCDHIHNYIPEFATTLSPDEIEVIKKRFISYGFKFD